MDYFTNDNWRSCYYSKIEFDKSQYRIQNNEYEKDNTNTEFEIRKKQCGNCFTDKNKS